MTKKYLASSEGKVKYECSSMVDYLSDTFEGLGLILSTVEKRTVYIYICLSVYTQIYIYIH